MSFHPTHIWDGTCGLGISVKRVMCDEQCCFLLIENSLSTTLFSRLVHANGYLDSRCGCASLWLVNLLLVVESFVRTQSVGDEIRLENQ